MTWAQPGSLGGRPPKQDIPHSCSLIASPGHACWCYTWCSQAWNPPASSSIQHISCIRAGDRWLTRGTQKLPWSPLRRRQEQEHTL